MNNAVNLVFGDTIVAHHLIKELDRFRGAESRKRVLLIGLLMFADNKGDTELYNACEDYLKSLKIGRPKLDKHQE